MLITLLIFIYAVLGGYLLGVATVFAIGVRLYDRHYANDAWQDNGGKVFLVRWLMWLPLIGAGLMAWKAIQHFMEVNLL
jgi:hypothetical protein